MVEIVTCGNQRRFSRQLASMFEDRKRVFVDILKWDLEVLDGRFEMDRFDDGEAVYFLIAGPDGMHQGSLRLLRTDRPHILGNIFPELCDESVPVGAAVREITRLCLSPRRPAAERLFLRNKLFSAMIDYALAQGISTLTGVVNLPFFTQLQGLGWQIDPLGEPHLIDGAMTIAFRIMVDETTCARLNAAGIYVPPILRNSSLH